jgi:hypothetical protein
MFPKEIMNTRIKELPSNNHREAIAEFISASRGDKRDIKRNAQALSLLLCEFVWVCG